jgi:hypothetical protein
MHGPSYTLLPKDGRNATPYGLLERNGVLSSNFTCIDRYLRIVIGSCANLDLCCVSPLWGIRICKPMLIPSLLEVLCLPQAFQGQFTLPLAYQGVSVFAWQTVGELLKPI